MVGSGVLLECVADPAVGSVLAVASLATLPATSPATAQASKPSRSTLTSQNALERPLVEAINAERQRRGLKRLRPSSELARAAEAHARAMGSTGFFAHESRDGTSASARIRRYYRIDGGSWLTGEILLWRSPGVTAGEALARWMASPTHRRVILTGGLRDVGVAAVRATQAPGVFGGLDVTILVVDFGARS